MKLPVGEKYRKLNFGILKSKIYQGKYKYSNLNLRKCWVFKFLNFCFCLFK